MVRGFAAAILLQVMMAGGAAAQVTRGDHASLYLEALRSARQSVERGPWRDWVVIPAVCQNYCRDGADGTLPAAALAFVVDSMRLQVADSVTYMRCDSVVAGSSPCRLLYDRVLTITPVHEWADSASVGYSLMRRSTGELGSVAGHGGLLYFERREGKWIRARRHLGWTT